MKLFMVGSVSLSGFQGSGLSSYPGTWGLRRDPRPEVGRFIPLRAEGGLFLLAEGGLAGFFFCALGGLNP